MQPIWFEWFGEVTGWSWLSGARLSQWIIFACSGLAAAGLGVWSMRRQGLDWRFGLGMIVSAVVVGGLFGHLISVLVRPDKLFADPWRLVILFRGGISSYGVYGGAVVGAVMWAKWRGGAFWPHADALAPGFLVGAALARMSCLLHGCDFGRVAPGLPWGIRYARGTPAFKYLEQLDMIDPFRDQGLPMHPFPLYEAAPVLLVGLVALLWPLSPGRVTGRRAAACAALYCIARLFAEHFRGEPVGPMPLLAAIQWLCLLGAALFALLGWRLGRSPMTDEARRT